MDARQLLSQINIFEQLSAEDVDLLQTLWKRRSLRKNEVLFRKGDTGSSMFVIEHGSLEITVPVEQAQKDMRVSVLSKGDFVGELSLLDGLPRTATARALEDCRLLEMRREDFIDFLKARPSVSISMISEVGKRLRTTNELVTSLASKNVNIEIEEQIGFGERLSDKIAEFGGSWGFIISFFSFLAIWMGLNTVQLWFKPFDEYPFIFLNLILNCLAAIQAPVIMMSQNRAQKKDRLRADLDYQVNLKSELMLQQLHTKVDELRATELKQLLLPIQEELAALRRQSSAVENTGNVKSGTSEASQ